MPSPTEWQAGKQCPDLGQMSHSWSRREEESTAPRSDKRSEVGLSYLPPPHKESAPGSPSWTHHRRFRPLPDGAPQAKGRQRCSAPRPSVQHSDVHHALLPRAASTSFLPSFLSLPALSSPGTRAAFTDSTEAWCCVTFERRYPNVIKNVLIFHSPKNVLN